MQPGQLTTSRAVPRSLAPLVEALELERPAVATGDDLARIAEQTGSPLIVAAMAERLVREGWLLPLRTRRSWEFVPGARAGRFGSGDPLIELRAVLAHRPDAPVAVGFDSAVWALGYSTHQPSTPVVVHRRGWRPPESLSHLRSVTFDWRVPTWDYQGLPAWSAATLAVAIAERPDAQGDWSNADEWLAEIMRAVLLDEVLVEAEGRSTTTLARLGHLAEWGQRGDIADQIESTLPKRLPVTYLGPRDRPREWVNRWRVYDSLLPAR